MQLINRCTAAGHPAGNVVSKLTRRERTNRLCTRAGMLESFLMESEALTNEQVMELLKTAFRQPEVKQKLKEMLLAIPWLCCHPVVWL